MKFDFQNLTVYKKAKLFHKNSKALISEKKLTSYEKDQLQELPLVLYLILLKAQEDSLKRIEETFL